MIWSMEDDFLSTETPMRCTSWRKLRQRKLNPVVHVDGRLVRIRAHIEGHGQAHASGPRADRVHVDHVIDAVDLAFEQRSHGLSDDVGARARYRSR